jgi:hypothetical protein
VILQLPTLSTGFLLPGSLPQPMLMTVVILDGTLARCQHCFVLFYCHGILLCHPD